MTSNHYQNHQRAAELHDLAAHAHRVAERHGESEHQDGQEHSRQVLEYSSAAHKHTLAAATSHGIVPFGHAEIAALAYKLWQARGFHQGSSDRDWFDAAEELRARARTH